MILYLHFIKVEGCGVGGAVTLYGCSLKTTRVTSRLGTKQGIELQEMYSSFVQKIAVMPF